MANYRAEILSDSPVQGWPMNEDAFNLEALEYFGQSNNAGNVGSVAKGATPFVGAPFTSAFTFAASDALLAIPTWGAQGALLNFGDGPITIEAWIKRSATQGQNMGLVSRNVGGYCLRLNAANQLEFTASTVAVIRTATPTLTDTASWHHVVGSKSGATTLLYTDGVLLPSTGTDFTLVDPVSPGAAYTAFIAADSNGTDGNPPPSWQDTFRGSMCEVWLYPTVLSAERILRHYQAGIVPPGDVPTPASRGGH